MKTITSFPVHRWPAWSGSWRSSPRPIVSWKRFIERVWERSLRQCPNRILENHGRAEAGRISRATLSASCLMLYVLGFCSGF